MTKKARVLEQIKALVKADEYRVFNSENGNHSEIGICYRDRTYAEDVTLADFEQYDADMKKFEEDSEAFERAWNEYDREMEKAKTKHGTWLNNKTFTLTPKLLRSMGVPDAPSLPLPIAPLEPEPDEWRYSFPGRTRRKPDLYGLLEVASQELYDPEKIVPLWGDRDPWTDSTLPVVDMLESAFAQVPKSSSFPVSQRVIAASARHMDLSGADPFTLREIYEERKEIASYVFEDEEEEEGFQYEDFPLMYIRDWISKARNYELFPDVELELFPENVLLVAHLDDGTTVDAFTGEPVELES